jgi:SWI/SNF-related matrix-associated actin-dependent regulator of chromatin subfamily A3
LYDEQNGDEFDIEADFADEFDSNILQLIQYGTVHTKIVGCRYYNGYITTGEMVVLTREPHNEYDANAIRVDNVRGEKVGHIPRQMAANLAPFMDNKSLLVEAVTTGRKDYYECPLQLNLFGTSDPVERSLLMAQMRTSKLPVTDARKSEQQERAREKERQRLEKEKQKEAMRRAKELAKAGANGQWSAGMSQGDGSMKSLENIVEESERFNARENFDQLVEKLGFKEDDLANMSMAKQPRGVLTKLLPYQRQGLHWMLDKESPVMPAVGKKETVQLWKRSDIDPQMITNVATNFSLKSQLPDLASGGILADDMGLGKTIQIISLIMSDQKVTQGTSKTTLILAPMSVMSNWSDQINKHIDNKHSLRVLIYHGQGKVLLTPSTIAEYDVVITTYETVMVEYWQKSAKPKPVPRKQGLFSISWRRVVLDEGHIIRNPAAKKSMAACNLLAKSRWVLTGTPIVNSLKDLYSVIKFLRLSGGLDSFEIFNRALIRPVNQGVEGGSLLLQMLMRSICLRRKKEMKFVNLNLPELSEYIHKVSFWEHEKEKYDFLEQEAKGTLAEYRTRQAGSTVQVYNHLLEVLIRLRQVCNHWKLCGKDRFTLPETFGTALELTPETTAALQDALQLHVEAQDDCPICMDTMTDPIITACTHCFCFPCIEKVIEMQKKCPCCRAELESTAKLVKPPVEKGLDLDVDIEESSSKVEALLTILRASRQKGDTKTVIFSQWTKFLDVAQKQLDKEGFKYCRIDGTMNTRARDAALDALENDPDCTVMLASLSVCSVGLNLVAANQVILADTWWAPAIEDQAIDRVHRLGQTRPCTVFRLVMENSIEESVLKLQEDKRKLMRLALAEGKGKRDKAKQSRLADIARLLQ